MSSRRHGSGELVRAYSQHGSALRSELVLASASLLQVDRRVRELARSANSVLFTGETGTGKTLFARELHRRADGDVLLYVGCASLTDSEVANIAAESLSPLRTQARSCVLLDEVGELTPWAQAVLLSGLERTRDVGNPMRIIAASHRNLDELVRAGRFSARLARLLGENVIAIPPLRERRADIAPLALHFLRLALGRADVACVSLDPLVLSRLEEHSWPGNARELKNIMERAYALAADGEIGLRDLPEGLQETARSAVTGAGS